MENAEVEGEHRINLRGVDLSLDGSKDGASRAVDFDDSAIDSYGIFEREGLDDVCIGFGDGGG